MNAIQITGISRMTKLNTKIAIAALAVATSFTATAGIAIVDNEQGRFALVVTSSLILIIATKKALKALTMTTAMAKAVVFLSTLMVCAL